MSFLGYASLICRRSSLPSRAENSPFSRHWKVCGRVQRFSDIFDCTPSFALLSITRTSRPSAFKQRVKKDLGFGSQLPALEKSLLEVLPTPSGSLLPFVMTLMIPVALGVEDFGDSRDIRHETTPARFSISGDQISHRYVKVSLALPDEPHIVLF